MTLHCHICDIYMAEFHKPAILEGKVFFFGMGFGMMTIYDHVQLERT